MAFNNFLFSLGRSSLDDSNRSLIVRSNRNGFGSVVDFRGVG